MGTVVSLGSINVDLTRRLTTADINRLADRHDWFPASGATVRISDAPTEIVDRSHDTFLGGKGANQAVAAALADAEAVMLGKVGIDESVFGVLDGLRDSGVDVEHVHVGDTETGKAFVFLDADGENRIAIVEGANGQVDKAYVNTDLDRICAADCLLLQNEIPVSPVLSLLDRLQEVTDRPTVIFDPSPVDGADPVIRHSAVDIVRPNKHEHAALADAWPEFEGTIVQTRGSDDVLVENDATFGVSPPPATAVDTTGAGDTFNGYLAAELARGTSLREAVEIATVAASMSIEKEGAQASIPALTTVRNAYSDEH